MFYRKKDEFTLQMQSIVNKKQVELEIKKADMLDEVADEDKATCNAAYERCSFCYTKSMCSAVNQVTDFGKKTLRSEVASFKCV